LPQPLNSQFSCFNGQNAISVWQNRLFSRVFSSFLTPEFTNLSIGNFQTPRAEIAIPACGVDNPRVRRWQSPHAEMANEAFFVPFFMMCKNSRM
jgi:hypothetical protein